MFHHTGTIPIETDRLILRRFAPEDAEAMFLNWASDEDVPRYMRWDTHKTIEETRSVLSSWIRNYEKDDFYLWAVTMKPDGMPIGTLGMFCVSTYDMCYDVAYCLGKAYWNRGYMTEALKAVLNFGLNTVGIHRIEAGPSVNNPGSGKVLLKCGMTYEGRLRQKLKCSMGFQDCDMYSILKSDLTAK